MEKKKVSVIIPVYNCEKYISETIDSVINQTYKNYEIIVVDDGSTDNTKNILLRYGKEIRYFYQENKGLPSARNSGIEQSKGEYIALLDSDDIWLPDKLESQIKALEANVNSAMIFTDTEIFAHNRLITDSWNQSNYSLDSGHLLWQIFQKKYNDGTIVTENIFHKLLNGNLICVSSVVIRKKYLDYVGYFDTSLSAGGEDYDMWLRLSKVFPTIYLNKVTTRYRFREDSLSGVKNLRIYKYKDTGNKALEKIFNNSSPSLKQLLKKKIYLNYRNASQGYLKNHNLQKARITAFKSLRYSKLQPKLYLYILLSFLPVRILKLFKEIRQSLALFLKGETVCQK